MLDVYLECGLVDSGSGDGGVVLKTSNIQVRLSLCACTPRPGVLTHRPQEALTFTEVMTPLDTWELLDMLDARVPLLWVLPGKEPEVLVAPFSSSLLPVFLPSFWAVVVC